MWQWVWGTIGLLPWGAPLVRNRRVVAWTVCVVGGIVASVYFQRDALMNGDGAQLRKVYLREDCDTVAILDGVRKAPSARDTLQWWTGEWAGSGQYWRPLSSLAFWLQWKVFGEDFRYYALVSVIVGVLVAALAFYAFEPLLGTDGATATVLAACVSLHVPWAREAPMEGSVGAWKLLPDPLAALGILAALGLAVRGRPFVALVPLTLSILAKEVGFFAFTVIPIALWWYRWRGGEVRSLRKVILCYGAVGLLMGVLRLVAVPGVYHMGSNIWWWWRALLYYFGHFGGFLQPQGWHVPAVVAVVGASGWVARRGVAWGMGLLVVGVGAVMWLLSLQLDRPLDVTVAACMLQLPRFITVGVWAIAAYLALRFSRQEVVLGVAFAVLGSAPTFLAAQTLDYTRWLGGFGHSILAWAAIRGAWQAAPLAARQLAQGFGPEPQSKEDPGEPPKAAAESSDPE